MQSQESGEQLPSLTQQAKDQPHKRKSSLRSLQEIQQRRSQANASQSQLQRGQAEQEQLQERQYESGDPRLMTIDRAQRGKTYLQGSIPFFQGKADAQSEQEFDGDEQSKVIQQSGKLRKRSPSSDMIRIKTTPITPRRIQQTIGPSPHDPIFSGKGNVTLRQSFKLQSLAPLENVPIPDMMNTQRNINQQQIGPLFQNNSGTLLANPKSNGGGDRSSRSKLRSASGIKGSNSGFIRPNITWGKKASTFQIKNAPPKEVSEFLQQVIQEPVMLTYQKPQDLDSTEALDSFLEALYIIVDEKVLDFSEELQQRIHLATGIRMEVCQDILSYFAQLQTRNKLLINAVEFFNEYLTKISQLEGDKITREKQIGQLLQDKEGLFLTKYDLERKIAEMTTELKKAQGHEKETVQELKSLQKRIDAKVAECDSLKFRIRHLEDQLQNQTEFIDQPSAQILGHPEGERHATIDSAGSGRNLRQNSQVSNAQTEQLRLLEATNKKLEIELSLMKDSLKKVQDLQFKDNVEHFVRIQELYNKVQIENKQLHGTNKKLESKLDAKERLVRHLEDKVTKDMIEKENVIVKLKSDIVLLKSTLQQNDLNFSERLQEENEKFQKEFSLSFSSQEKKLKDEKEQVVREKQDLSTRITLLTNEQQKLADEFTKYRSDISRKDVEKEQSIFELQQKLKESTQLNEQQTKSLQERIETYNNQCIVLQKQNGIGGLKLRLIKDSVETLFKQKIFIMENIERSRVLLLKESEQVEEKMMKQNDDKEYLISIKKAVKLSKEMLDMGFHAISQVQNIVGFLKIDEVRNMIIDQDFDSVARAAGQGEVGESQQEDEIDKLNLLFQQEDIQQQDNMLGKNQQQADQVQTLRIHKLLQGNLHQGKEEDYYYSETPLELATVLAKVLAEALLSSSSIDENKDLLPPELYRLISHGTRKADPEIEQEIYRTYLVKARKMIEDKYVNLIEENKKLSSQIDKMQKPPSIDEAARGDMKSRLRNISKASGSQDTGATNPMPAQGEGQPLEPVSDQRRGNSASIEETQQVKKNPSMNQLIEGKRASALGPRLHSANRRSAGMQQKQSVSVSRVASQPELISNLETQIESQKIKLEEQRLKYKDISMGLAQKIVLMEEQLEEKKLKQEQEMAELELLQREEILQTKKGIEQREAQLIMRAEEYKQRTETAEEQLKKIREEVTFLKNKIETINTFQKDFDIRIMKKNEEIMNFKENVQTYVNLKVSQRNMFSLTLEITKDNMAMITEAMLKFYLNKSLKIAKDKFRVLKTDQEQFILPKKGGQLKGEEITVAKILIEIVDDQDSIDKYLKQLKTQVRDGTSILFDLQPLFLSLNLGCTGLQINDKAPLIRDYHLIKRKGVSFKEEDFVVSVLRHKRDPMSFKLIAASQDLGEEYMLDLDSRDLIELTEGQTALLEASEPSDLIECIIDNLNITEGAHRILQCEHKVFFSHSFMKTHAPQPISIKQQDKLMKTQSEKSTTAFFKGESSQDSLAFRNTAFRNNQIIEKVALTKGMPNESYQKILKVDTDCQTDFSQSLETKSLANLFSHNSKLEANVQLINTYNGYQKVGKSLEMKIKIDECFKTGICLISLEEVVTKERCQVILQDNSMIGTQKPSNRYVLHTECLKFFDTHQVPHMLIVTFERFPDDSGFLFKIHDLKVPSSEEFFILRKSNNQFSKLSRAAGIERLLANGKEHEELRNLMFDLTFTLSVPSQQILYANIAQMEHQMASIGEPLEGELEIRHPSDFFQVPHVKRSGKVKEAKKVSSLQSLKIPAIPRYQSDPFCLPSGILLQKNERGELLYRNLFRVRCVFENKKEREHQSLISFYDKRGESSLINVEVFLYRESQKMSIASQVSSQDLFGQDFHTLSYIQKVEMLDQMMEKLFVLSENGQFHLKVENEAPAMTEVLQERKRQEQIREEQKANQNLLLASPSPAHLVPQPTLQNEQAQNESPMSIMHQTVIENKLKEIEANLEGFLNDPKVTFVKTFAQLNDKHYDYCGYFLPKQEPARKPSPDPVLSQSPSRKFAGQKQTQKKANIDRQTNMSSNYEELLDFEWVFVEVTDRERQRYSCLLSTKLLVHVMSGSPFETQSNMALLASKEANKKDKIVEYLRTRTKIDESTGIMKIESFQPSHEYILQVFSNEIGGSYLRREESAAKLEIESQLLDKRLLMNQEVDLSEFTYDVKLYQIFNKTAQISDKKVLSYCFEIFSLNEPDLVYRYNYALHEQSSFIHSPVHIGYDIVNLIENHQSKVRQTDDPKRKQEFAELFTKYIDNKFLFIVHEQIFPHQISFCMYEPSSRLHWSHTFDPQMTNDPEYLETMSKAMLGVGRWNVEIGQLSIMDLGTAERFIAFIMADVLEPNSIIRVPTPAVQDVREDIWVEVGDSESLRYDLVKGRLIAEDLAINITKIGTDCLNIEIYNQKYAQEMIQNVSKGSRTKPGESTKKSVALQQSSFINNVVQDIALPSNQMVKFVVNTNQRNKYIAKLLRVKDHEFTRLLMAVVSLSANEINIKIIEAFSPTVLQGDQTLKPRIIYSYQFKEKKGIEDVPIKIARKNFQDAISEVCTCGITGTTSLGTVDKASKLFDTMMNRLNTSQTDQIFTENLTLSQRRLITTGAVQSGTKGDKQNLVLHRKTFYDESHDKLIIVSVSIDCIINRRKGHGPAQMCLQDVETLMLNINEPETKKKMDFYLRIDHCFLEQEINGGIDLKNIAHLKKMARVLVEERALIKRVSSQTVVDDLTSDNLYTVEINLANSTPLNINEPQIPHQQEAPPQHKPQEKVSPDVVMEEEHEEDQEEDLVKKSTGTRGQQATIQQQPFRLMSADRQQQSVIEEEAELEEQEDSPAVAERDNKYNDRSAFKLHRTELEDEEVHRGDENEQEDLNEDIGVVEEDDEEDAYSNNSLLYERETPDGMILQVIHAPSGDPDSVFFVRQRTPEGDIIMNLSVNIQTIQMIAKEANLPMSAIETLHPDLIDAIAEYVIRNSISA